jgi:hypothetical protein
LPQTGLGAKHGVFSLTGFTLRLVKTQSFLRRQALLVRLGIIAIGLLAYSLAQMLKGRVLPESSRTATVATLRWKLYRPAGKLVRHVRGWMLQTKADWEKWRLPESARRRCAPLAT